MSQRQQVHLYCLCWNDARMLPFFFRHYDSIVDHYFIYDNGSTDQSRELLEAHERVSVIHFDVAGDSFVDEERRLSDSIWHQSRGIADWVIVLDIDEHVFHPNLADYLSHCTQSNVTALRSIGYEMVADHFPSSTRPLVECVTIGVRSSGHDKLCIFNPDAVTDSCFSPGRHGADPKGWVRWPDQSEILMLHYKQLGVEYAIRRSSELRAGLGEGDKKQNWGIQYLWSESEIAEKWSKLRAIALPVPGLGSLSDVAPEFFDEEHVIARSGLIDAKWYWATYPDVKASGMSALAHYCIHGWKEDRRPNFYFHPEWYREQCRDQLVSGQNCLIHYINGGEATGVPPSPQFDPVWYRERHGLESPDSPLAHYLAHRQTEHTAPLPTFDAAAYAAEFPQRVMGFEDLFEEFCWRGNLPRWQPEAPEPPAYPSVISRLGFDPFTHVGAVVVDPAAVLDVLKRFLGVIRVDEDWYRLEYPDVAAAIEEGSLLSAHEHFVKSGYFEGRSNSPDTSAKERR